MVAAGSWRLEMFTLMAFALGAGAVWYAGRMNEQDRRDYDRTDDLRPLVLHIRQDLKLICFLLLAVIVILGAIADRIH